MPVSPFLSPSRSRRDEARNCRSFNESEFACVPHKPPAAGGEGFIASSSRASTDQQVIRSRAAVPNYGWMHLSIAFFQVSAFNFHLPTFVLSLARPHNSVPLQSRVGSGELTRAPIFWSSGNSSYAAPQMERKRHWYDRSSK